MTILSNVRTALEQVFANRMRSLLTVLGIVIASARLGFAILLPVSENGLGAVGDTDAIQFDEGFASGER